jgi:hypothetical protein
MIELVRQLDLLLFGPTVQFAARSRYSLADSVARLRASLLPRWNPLARLRPGLCGRVKVDDVFARWYNPMVHNLIRPAFAGSFRTENGQVVLRGEIGVSRAQKIRVFIAMLLFLALPLVALALHVPERAAVLWPMLLPLVALLATVVLSVVRRCDVKRIADALDNALS